MHTKTTSRNRFLTGFVVALVLIGIAVPSTAAAQSTTTGTTVANGTTTGNQTATANDVTASTADLTVNATAARAVTNHTLDVTLGEPSTSNLTRVSIDYTAANASTEPVLDDVDDLEISVANRSLPAGENVTVAATNFRLVNYSFTLNRSLQPEAGDQLHFRYPVQNPTEPGNYTVDVLLDVGGNRTESLTTNLTVTPNETAPAGSNGTTTAEMNSGGTSREQTTQASTSDGATTGNTTGGAATNGGSTTTSGNGPGFTVTVGLVCVLAAALLALRRD